LAALCWKLLSVPPVTVMSAKPKSVASLSVKLSVADCPARTVLASLLMATVGGVVSITKGLSEVEVVTPFCVTCSTGV
jgi:hypothetical protein